MRVRLILALLTGASVAYAQPPHHVLQATPKAVTWGRYGASTPPVLRIHSGDIVERRAALRLT